VMSGAPAGSVVSVTAHDPRWGETFEGEDTTDAQGNYSVSFVVPPGY
jgi:hypothetical protein